MNVLTLLSEPVTKHVRRVLEDDHQLFPTSSVRELARMLSVEHIDVALVDPAVVLDRSPATDNIAALSSALRNAPLVPFLICASARHSVLWPTIELFREATAVSMCDLDQFTTRDALLAALDSALQVTLGRKLLDHIAPALAPLPRTLRRALQRTFDYPLRLRTPDDIANAASLTRRSMDRWFNTTGLASARTLLHAARAVMAYRLLRTPGRRVYEVVAIMGYPNARGLASELQHIIGLCPRDLRNQHDENTVLLRLASAMSRVASARTIERGHPIARAIESAPSRRSATTRVLAPVAAAPTYVCSSDHQSILSEDDDLQPTGS